jgi:hypothetical protein
MAGARGAAWHAMRVRSEVAGREATPPAAEDRGNQT